MFVWTSSWWWWYYLTPSEVRGVGELHGRHPNLPSRQAKPVDLGLETYKIFCVIDHFQFFVSYKPIQRLILPYA